MASLAVFVSMPQPSTSISQMPPLFMHFGGVVNSVERRIDLQSKFNRIEGITIPDVEKNPVFNLSVLHNVASYNAFVDIIKEMIEDFKKCGK